MQWVSALKNRRPDVTNTADHQSSRIVGRYFDTRHGDRPLPPHSRSPLRRHARARPAMRCFSLEMLATRNVGEWRLGTLANGDTKSVKIGRASCRERVEVAV